MDIQIIFPLFLMLVGMLMISKSSVVISENKRAGVYRLGKLEKIIGPGFHLVVPFIDTVKCIDLNNRIPGWVSLDPDSLQKKLREIFLTEPT